MSSNDDPWAGIGAAPSHVVGRRVEEPHALAVYWVRRADGAPGVVFRDIHEESLPTVMPRPRGVEVQQRNEQQPEIGLFLLSAEHREVFVALCRDVVEASGRHGGASDATSALFRRLLHWQGMLSAGRPTEMGPPEVRGLMAELWVLDELHQRIGIQAALRTWVAPDDHPQDFAFAKGIVEVKARLAGSRPRVTISSLEQLEPSHLPICLLVAELTPAEGDDAPSLNSMVDALCGHAAQAGPEVEEDLGLALRRRGYAPSPRYDDLRHNIAGTRVFSVEGDFPRLTRSGTDCRIPGATYLLDLTSLTSFERDLDGTLTTFAT